MRPDTRNGISSAFEGCYEAPRAAALSGVPISTLYECARKGVVSPSTSTTRPRRWSYADLMALRIVYWLRHDKDGEDHYPPSPMPEVRRALEQLETAGLDLWTSDRRTPLLVDRRGHITIITPDGPRQSDGQGRLDVLDLLAPFALAPLGAPDLVRPRLHLQIVPGKVSGEPHLEHSRLTTLTIAALADRGYEIGAIAALYPDEDPIALAEAIDLEHSLHLGEKAAA